MGNNCYQNRGCCGCNACGNPFDRLQELNRMCGCASGVIAEAISSCDCFCRANACNRSRGCGCKKDRDHDCCD